MEPLVPPFTPTARDTLGRATYFADCTKDVGKGYIGGNFGQELRNVQRAVAYAQAHDATRFGAPLVNHSNNKHLYL